MLPRMLDVALASPLFDLAKFVILPLLVGLALRVELTPFAGTWPRISLG